MKKPLILITNDDSINAKGLRKLISLMRPLGDVVVISTVDVMSAKGHSITTTPTLKVTPVQEMPGYREFVCNGTPVDCVKAGYQWLLDKAPDLVVSGINHGSNASTNVIYSGTMAAVIEACMDGIDGIGFSLDSYAADADFDHLDAPITAITQEVIAHGLPKGVCLNVNFPYRREEPIRGIRVCRQAQGRWVEAYNDFMDEHGNNCLKLGGAFICDDDGEDTDYWAINHNYISVVPTHYDLTAMQYLDKMSRFEKVMNVL